MSKCKPGATIQLQALEQFGVTLSDSTKTIHTAGLEATPERRVIISIPYEALRDQKDVQIAFQDLVRISTTE